jgi:hypothetical protein
MDFRWVKYQLIAYFTIVVASAKVDLIQLQVIMERPYLYKPIFLWQPNYTKMLSSYGVWVIGCMLRTWSESKYCQRSKYRIFKEHMVPRDHGTFSLKLILIRYIKMDLRSWESLWKVLVTIGVGNLFLFFIIVFVFTINNSILVWILIAIESGCYLDNLIVRRRIRQLLRQAIS